MATSLASLGLDRLSVEERLELIESLWNSLPDQPDLHDIPDWHLAELATRRADATANPGVGKPWREAIDTIEDKS